MKTGMIPRHIAIIMDGNGRWAKQRLLPRVAGHKAGAEAVRRVVKRCVEMKVEVLTLFAFSSENWKRPITEISYLMDLFISALKREAEKLHEQNVQLRIIGDRTRLDEKLCKQIITAEQLTAKNTGLKLVLAVNYGGRWDIADTLRQIATQIEAGHLTSAQITPELIQEKIALSELPEPDLLIRTSGEQRISNFMLWQLAYTELYFTNVFWPDFNGEELEKACAFFANRERRFGTAPEPAI